MGKRIDITGQKFGRLTAIRDVGSIGKGRRWECLCDCGNTTIVNLKDLRCSKTKSCGCLSREHAAELGRKTAPMMHKLNRVPLAERFQRHVDTVNRPMPTTCAPHFGPCLIWTGAVNADGRANMGVDGKTKLSSHVAWFLEHGYWPVDHLCHACDNKRCVNVYHLFEGTDEVNKYDLKVKDTGRFLCEVPSPKGPNCKSYKQELEELLASIESEQAESSVPLAS